MGCIKRDKKSCLGLPLAPTALLLLAIIIVSSIVQLVQGLNYAPIDDASNLTSIIIAAIFLLLALLSTIGIFKRSPRLCNLGSKVIFPGVIFVVIEIIAQWWRWGWELNGKKWERNEEGKYIWVATEKWKPTGGEIFSMFVWTFFELVLLFILFQLISVFASLAAVYAAGGSGWSWKNAEGVREKKARKEAEEAEANANLV